jgi:putative membrane protein insertion efficiency factor
VAEAHVHPPLVVMPTGRLGRVVAAPIVAYRRWISPALPPTCRFYPSCSEYALTAVAVHGPVRGIWLAARRLLRCHPFNPGGIDHVPPRITSDDDSPSRTKAGDPPFATHQEH